VTSTTTHRAYRLRSMRAFSPYRTRRSAREVRERWAALFDARGADHPYWMHVHIPFCPQSCSYCQCSRKLLSHEDELREYLAWLHDEIRYFAEVGQRGLVRFQYLGGGTPNMLSAEQLEALFAELNTGYR
jgi:coproporphyrinogen III oxidase-like Fe-S oxidoreductase